MGALPVALRLPLVPYHDGTSSFVQPSSPQGCHSSYASIYRVCCFPRNCCYCCWRFYRFRGCRRLVRNGPNRTPRCSFGIRRYRPNPALNPIVLECFFAATEAECPADLCDSDPTRCYCCTFSWKEFRHFRRRSLTHVHRRDPHCDWDDFRDWLG